MRCGKWVSALMILLASGFCPAALGDAALPVGSGHSFMLQPLNPLHRFDHRGGFRGFHHGDRFIHHRHSSVLLIGVPLFWPDEDAWPTSDAGLGNAPANGLPVLYYC